MLTVDKEWRFPWSQLLRYCYIFSCDPAWVRGAKVSPSSDLRDVRDHLIEPGFLAIKRAWHPSFPHVVPPSTFNQQIMTEAMPDLGMSARGWLLVGSGGSREVNFCVHAAYSFVNQRPGLLIHSRISTSYEAAMIILFKNIASDFFLPRGSWDVYFSLFFAGACVQAEISIRR